MKQNKIEDALARSINQAPALDFQALMEQPYLKLEEQDFITRQEEERAIAPVRKYTAAFSLCVAVLLFFVGGWYYQYRLPNSVISLDVNPSIEIVTNRHNQVLAVHAINLDAKQMFQNQEYKSADLNTTVSAVIASVIREGYLNTEKNVIMVSVQNKNLTKAEVLALSLRQTIKDSALTYDVTPLILRQTFPKNKAAATEAKQLKVSVGKLRLIQRIKASDVTESTDNLASMSMTELFKLSEEHEVDLKDTLQFDEGVSESGSAAVQTEEDNREEKGSQFDKQQKDKNKSEKDKNKTKIDKSQKDKDKPLPEKGKGATQSTKPDKLEAGKGGSASDIEQNKESSAEAGRDQNKNNNNKKDESKKIKSKKDKKDDKKDDKKKDKKKDKKSDQKNSKNNKASQSGHTGEQSGRNGNSK